MLQFLVSSIFPVFRDINHRLDTGLFLLACSCGFNYLSLQKGRLMILIIIAVRVLEKNSSGPFCWEYIPRCHFDSFFWRTCWSHDENMMYNKSFKRGSIVDDSKTYIKKLDHIKSLNMEGMNLFSYKIGRIAKTVWLH